MKNKKSFVPKTDTELGKAIERTTKIAKELTEAQQKRRAAMLWWNSLDSLSKSTIAMQLGKLSEDLTGREIQIVWEKIENQNRPSLLDDQEEGYDLDHDHISEDYYDQIESELEEDYLDDLNDSKWNLENDPHSLDYLSKPTKTKELVDFEAIKGFVNILLDDYVSTRITFDHEHGGKIYSNDKMIEQLRLFFKKLSQSSSFAHLAHKKLKQ